MANEIQKALTGAVAAAAAGVYAAKEGSDIKKEQQAKAIKEAKQEKRAEQLHALNVESKQLKIESQKLKLERIKAKARDSLEAAREQAKNKKNHRDKVFARMNKHRKAKK